MIKRIGIIVMSVLVITPASNLFAQSSEATQLIKVNVEPTIEISAMTIDNVNLGFNNITSYLHGVESGTQEFLVHSNKDFVVNVKTNSSTFSYSGNSFPAPKMPVNEILFLSVTNNNTGGVIANSFNSYVSLSDKPKDLLLNCGNGGGRTFAINYRANPGTRFPAGDYTIGVVYTATQP